MSRSQKDGGLPARLGGAGRRRRSWPSRERLVGAHHERGPHAMIQVALAPCSPFSVTPELMRKTAELAERLDVRLHTHLAEDADEDTYCLEVVRLPAARVLRGRRLGHRTARGWPTASTPTRPRSRRWAAWGTGVAHCPSSNQMIGAGLAPIREFRAAGVPVGIGCDGSASTDSASLWMETRNACCWAGCAAGPRPCRPATRSRWPPAAAPRAWAATARSASCRRGRSATWSSGRSRACSFAGAWSDPIEAWLRCGPLSPATPSSPGGSWSRTAGLVDADVDDMLDRHAAVARRWQAPRLRPPGRTGRTPYSLLLPPQMALIHGPYGSTWCP